MSEGMKSIIRKRLARAIDSALNFKGMSAGSPKVMIEVSDAQNLLKLLDAPVVSAGVADAIAKVKEMAQRYDETANRWQAKGIAESRQKFQDSDFYERDLCIAKRDGLSLAVKELLALASSGEKK